MQRPNKFPAAWPTDGRSKLKNLEQGWTLTHPDRTPMIYRDERWIDVPAQEQAA